MLRGGIVGFGRMGLTHFSILNAHPSVKVVAVCDSSSFLRGNAVRYMEVKAFRSPDKMLDEMALDFIVVATPTAAHAEMVGAAVERGVHVFVEKPFALDAQQGKTILRLLEDNPVVNQVGYVLRFNDVFLQVKKLLENKVIGDLLSFKMEMYGPTVLHPVKNTWRSKKSKGGGCLYDFASHSIDLINYLVGVPDEVAGTVLQRVYSEAVEDAVSSTFFYKSGARGTLLVNWSDPSYRKPTYRFEAFGQRGKIIADLHEFRLFLNAKAALNGFAEGWNRRYLTDIFQPVKFYLRGFEFTRQLDHFVDCVSRQQTGDVSSFEQAHQTDLLIERLRQDAERRNS